MKKSKYLFNINDENLYCNWKNVTRTRNRIIQIAEMGMHMFHNYSFGIKGIMSGLYLERVWSYSDEQWNDYINWVIELTKETNLKSQKLC